MMVRILTAAAGIASASTVALIEVATAAPPSVTFGWSLIAGVGSAGVTYGVLTSKVANAHRRITEATAQITAEKCDRERAVSELKADVNRGFDDIKSDLREQTRTVIEALRNTGK